MTTRSSILTLVAMLALASCSGQSDADAADDTGVGTPVEEASPDPDAPISILRPDVEQPEQEPTLLEPLNVVVGFPKGGSDLDALAEERLREILDSEQLATSATIILRGHSDAGGNDAVNERASQARAEAVRDWLIEEGVDEDRFQIIAFGEQNPVQPNALPDGEPNEAGRAVNRRVELSIVPPKGTVQKAPPPAANATPSTESSD